MNTETEVYEYHLRTSNRACGQTAQEIYARGYNAGKSDGQAYILDKLRTEIEELKKIDEKHQSVIDNIEISETHGLKESNVRVHNPQRERYMKFDGKLSAYDKVLDTIDKYREVSG